MKVFERFKSAGAETLVADPLGLQNAIDTVERLRAELDRAQGRMAELEAATSPRAEERTMQAAAATGNFADLLAFRKSQADAHVELEVLRRYVPQQQHRVRQAQDHLSTLKVRQMKVGQAAHVAALHDALPALLEAFDRFEAAASEHASWSFDLRGQQINPLLAELGRLRRYIEEDQWPKLVNEALTV